MEKERNTSRPMKRGRKKVCSVQTELKRSTIRISQSLESA